MRKLLITTIVLLLQISLLKAEVKFPVKRLKDILKLENVIKTEVRGADSVIIRVDQIERFHNGYLVSDTHKAKKLNYYDSRGKYLRSIGRKGEGPEEFDRPYFLLVRENGYLTVCSHPPYKLLTYNRKLEYLNEFRVIDKLSFRPDMGLHCGNRFIFLTGESVKSGKQIYVTDNKYKILGNFCKVEPLSKILSVEVTSYVAVGETVWVAKKFDPYIEIFNMKSGKLIRTLGVDLKRRDHCLYSNMLEDDMTKGDYKANYQRFFQVWSGRCAALKVINVDDKYVLHGPFYKMIDKKRERFFDIYDVKGRLLQEHVPSYQEFNEEEDTFHGIPYTSAKKLFFVNYNIDIDEEEDISSIIYQYGSK